MNLHTAALGPTGPRLVSPETSLVGFLYASLVGHPAALDLNSSWFCWVCAFTGWLACLVRVSNARPFGQCIIAPLAFRRVLTSYKSSGSNSEFDVRFLLLTPTLPTSEFKKHFLMAGASLDDFRPNSFFIEMFSWHLVCQILYYCRPWSLSYNSLTWYTENGFPFFLEYSVKAKQTKNKRGMEKYLAGTFCAS